MIKIGCSKMTFTIHITPNRQNNSQHFSSFSIIKKRKNKEFREIQFFHSNSKKLRGMIKKAQLANLPANGAVGLNMAVLRAENLCGQN